MKRPLRTRTRDGCLDPSNVCYPAAINHRARRVNFSALRTRGPIRKGRVPSLSDNLACLIGRVSGTRDVGSGAPASPTRMVERPLSVQRTALRSSARQRPRCAVSGPSMYSVAAIDATPRDLQDDNFFTLCSDARRLARDSLRLCDARHAVFGRQRLVARIWRAEAGSIACPQLETASE
jgi:hypothetical protein